MSTPSTTIIKNLTLCHDEDGKVQTNSVAVAQFYRHWDGYPAGHGMDILNALIAASRDKDINNRNWCQHFLKHLCAGDIDIEFEPVGTPESAEYIYYVEGVVNNLGGKAPIDGAEFTSNIRIEVVDALSGQVMFSNRMEQYAEWLREQDGSMLD